MEKGQQIKAARKAAGLTQKELGSRIGVTYQTVAQWENGLRHPKWETIERIAAALGVPESYFWDTSPFKTFESARQEHNGFVRHSNASPHICNILESLYGKKELLTLTDEENFFKENIFVFGSDDDSIALSSDHIFTIESALIAVIDSLIGTLSSTKNEEIEYWKSWFSSEEAKRIRDSHANNP